ncbi:hypothetical protein F7R14_11390 [Pseudomonas lini]|uniref:DUF1534 domain-containing protein n=1 Tax=Pseudomonas lini TaxID=163011 RepID=A0A7V7P5E1_9PSED|nr:hypothetical protein F7R14_11390 [Pseudomonas lini]
MSVVHRFDRSHALRGNAAVTLCVTSVPGSGYEVGLERRASLEAFPRGAWERSARRRSLICGLLYSEG